MDYEMLDYGSSFTSEPCLEGIVTISVNTLRTNLLNQTTVPLQYTPCRLALHSPSQNFCIMESDYNTWCPSDKTKIKKILKDRDPDEDGEIKQLPKEHFGLLQAHYPGKFGIGASICRS